MHALSNRTESDSIGQAFLEDRNIGEDNSRQIIIKQANSIPIFNVLKIYGIKLDELNKKTICPFPQHKERTPSFNVYPDTNSFYCFGCKEAGGPVKLTANINSSSLYDAAIKLLQLFDNNLDIFIEDTENNIAEKTVILMDFSNLIYGFIHQKENDNKRIIFAEKISMIFDKINDKHKLNNEALLVLSNKLKTKLLQYK